MGTIGPKPNPRPVILHVDSDTNIPYRLAESDVLVVSSITASSYNNLPSIGGATSIDQLAGTGVFATTATNVSSFAGTGVLATQTFVNNSLTNYVTNANLDSALADYVGPITPGAKGDIVYYDGGVWVNLPIGNPGQSLLVDNGAPAWGDLAGSVPAVIPISQGGTNSSATPVTSGVIHYNGTRYATNSNLTFNGTTLNANTLALTNPLLPTNGGTGQTALSSVTVQSFGGVLPVNKGGTNSTTLVSNGVLYYNNATTAVGSVTSLTFNGTTLAAPQLSLTTALPVSSGGTGRTTLTAGNFLVGNGTSQVSFQPTATYVTTSFANTNYFNKSTDVLTVAQGGTNTNIVPDNNTLLFYNSANSRYEGNESILIGTTDKLICGSGVAIPSKQIFVQSNPADLNPTTTFKLNDLPGVNVPSPNNGDLLSFNSPNWVNISVLPIVNGGTGATTNSNARANLGLGSLATSNSLSLNNLSNVTITTPTTNQVLSYNGTNWVNSTPSGGSSETWTTVFLQNDENNGNNSLVDSTLSASLTSGKTYSYEFNVLFGATLSDKISFAVSSPSITSHYWNIDYTTPTTGSFANKRSLGGLGNLSKKDGTVDGDGYGVITIKGTITPSANGALKFTFSTTNAGADSVDLFAGSYLKYAAIN